MSASAHARIPTVALHVGEFPTGLPLSGFQIGEDRVAIEHHLGPRVSCSGELAKLCWDELIAQFEIHRVYDHGGSGLGERLSVLFGALEPSGEYVVRGIEAVREDDSVVNEEIDASLNKDSLRAIKRLMDSRTVETSGRVLTLRRSAEPRWLMKARAVSELQPAAPLLAHATRYGRIRPIIVGSSEQEARLSRLTSGYADQSVPEQRLAVLNDVVISGLGQVHVGRTEVVEETFAHTLHRRERGLLIRLGETSWYSSLMDLQPRSSARIVDGPAIILKQAWDANYGHWLIDCFGRLALLRHHVDLSKQTFVLSKLQSEAMTRVMLDSLSLLGVKEEQVVFEGTHTFTVRQAFVPGPLTKAPLVKHPAVIGFLESLVSFAEDRGGFNHAPSGRVYLSRNRTGKRVMRNEEQLLEVLRPHGYELIYPEALSFFDQVCTLGRASKVIGNMGAAFANLAFSPAGVEVACIATPAMGHDYFYDIACHKRGRYLGIQAPQFDGATIAADFTLPVGAALEALRAEHFLD